jgi:hypothetical protein
MEGVVMKQRLLIILLVLTLLIPSGIAIASNISSALYKAIITVSNNSTTATDVSTVYTLNSDTLISQGWVDSDFTNVAIYTPAAADAPFMPGANSTNPWCLFVPSIAENANLSYVFYAGGNASMSATKYIFLEDAGMTVTDNASAEPGDNCTVTMSGWLDTDNASGKYLFQKKHSFEAYIDTDNSGNVTARLRKEGVSGHTNIGTYADGWGAYVEQSYSETTVGGLRLRLKNNGDITFRINMCQVWDSEIDEWVTPSSVSDAGSWSDSANATDGDTGTYASHAYPGANVYSTYLTLQLPCSVNSTKVRTWVSWSGAGPNTFVRDTDYGDGYTDAIVSATGVDSGEYIVATTIGSPVFPDYNALHFDGTGNSEVDCGAIYNAAGTIWVDFWFKLDSNYSAANPTDKWILGKYINDNNFLLIRLNATDGTLGIINTTGGVEHSNVKSTQTAWTADTQYHILASWSAVNGVRLRVDNGAAQTDADTTAIVNGGDFTIGNLQTGGGNGVIGHIYNVTVGTDDLSLAEETALYLGVFPGDETDAWYMDEGTGTTITSYGSSGNDGTAGAATAWQTTDRPIQMYLEVDSTIEDVLIGANCTAIDNGNDWDFCLNGAFTYLEYVELTVGGTQVGYWDWEYGDYLYDDSDYGNTATPAFRTTTSNANVTANITSFEPISEAQAPAYTVADAPFFLSDNISATGNFTSSNVTSSTGPSGSEIIEAAAEAGETPNIWLWGILAIITLAMVGFFISYMERQFGAGGGGLMLRIIFAAIIFGILITYAKFDWWMLVLYAMIAVTFAIASRHIDLSGALTQYGLIGFLAMSWVGLTLINRILEGQFMQGAETTLINNLAFTQTQTLFGLFKIPVINFDFFTTGIPRLAQWDYSFFGGNAAIFQYMLYSLTAVLSFVIVIIIIGVVFNMASRARV